MDNIQHLEEKIELYVKGKLNGNELLQFEQHMSTDATLAAEVKWQQHIVSAVKQSRMADLKTRLQNIDVSVLPAESGIGHTVSSLLTSKSAAVLLASIGFGVGAYVYFSNNNESKANAVQVKPRTEQLQAIVDEDDESTHDYMPAEHSYTEQNASQTDNMVQEAATKRSETVAAKKSATSTKAKLAVPKGDVLEQQEVNNAAGDGLTKDTEAPKEKLAERTSTTAADIDIKPISETKYKFHYMLKENTLYLYGNFDASPYEILELNDAGGQSFYLYYDNSYFVLQQGNIGISKLKKITDTAIIANLNGLRTKKH